MLNKKKLFALLIIAVVMSSCGLFSCTPTEGTVKEDDGGEWRIYDDRGRNRGTWTVDEGEEITWIVTGSDMIFSFPLEMETYFEVSDGLFTGIDSVYTGLENDPRRIEEIAEGDSLKLRLNVIEDAETDTIDYDIYVIDAQKYVIGNSPPYLIIRRSHKN